MQKHLCRCEVSCCLTGKSRLQGELGTRRGGGVGGSRCGSSWILVWMPCLQAFSPSAHDSRAGLSHWSHSGHVPVPCDARAGPPIKELPHLPVLEGALWPRKGPQPCTASNPSVRSASGVRPLPAETRPALPGPTSPLEFPSSTIGRQAFPGYQMGPWSCSCVSPPPFLAAPPSARLRAVDTGRLESITCFHFRDSFSPHCVPGPPAS